MKCKTCGKVLTPEDRLLAAIFGEDREQCSKCYEIQQMPKCEVCGKVTNYSLNGKPLCIEHLEVAAKKGGQA